MVRYSEGARKSVTGEDLFTCQWLPDQEQPRAIFCFHHGVQEHILRYNEVFTTMADAGIAVYSHDAIGHGRSTGPRAFFSRFSDVVDDFEGTAAAVTAAHPGVHKFIGGQSLGGLIAAVTCLKDQKPWAGLLVLSPAMDVEWTPMLRVQAAMGNLLAAVIPRARIVPAVEISAMNRDPAKCKEYAEDPLNTVGPLPVRTGNEGMRAFKEMARRRSELTLPVYAQHGTADKCTSFSATKAFIEGISSTDKTFVPVEGGFHELLNESECRDELVRGMINWMLVRSTAGGVAKI